MTYRIDTDSFGFLITDLARMLRLEMDRRIAEAGLGLTAGEARALVHVARSGAARQSLLAERMGVEAMTLSAFLDRLEARGLVTRETDPSDRRAKLIRLTGSADAVLEQIADATSGIREQALRDLSEQEWAALKTMLKRVRASLSESRADCKPERAA